MNELSLYTGCGGGLLGTHLLGWKPKGYVEIDDYCQRVIAQRIADGLLPPAPIFSDVRTFISEGFAASYQGMVDVVTGGFPCQPFSVAGRKAGKDDDRNMWPETIEVIRQVRPRYAFLENVRGLLSSGYFQEILKDLAESGYDARWRVLSAAEVGAPHRRDRVWIVAHANGQYVSDATIQGLEGKKRQEHERGRNRPPDISWWEAEPDVGRVANGVASRVDRLKAIGNGQVPGVVRAAWELLSGAYDE